MVKWWTYLKHVDERFRESVQSELHLVEHYVSQVSYIQQTAKQTCNKRTRYRCERNGGREDLFTDNREVPERDQGDQDRRCIPIGAKKRMSPTSDREVVEQTILC